MSRTFAQIETTLPHSKKIRQLDHQQRWAYLCAHLSPLGGFTGLFRYPIAVWADDADLIRSDLEETIKQMISVGLVDYSQEDEFLRIVGWFMKKNAPENASRMASLAADFSSLDAPDDMLLASAAEFTVGSVKRAQRWKPDSSEWEKLRGVFSPFLAKMRQNFEDDFHQAMSDQMQGQNQAVKAEICALMPSLQHFMEAPCPHPADTVGAHETKTRRDGDETYTRKELDETRRISSENVQPISSALRATVGDAEKERKTLGPRPETIAAAKRIGAIR